MKVSLIATILNEGQAIRKMLDTLESQSRQPDELIFVDGGSTDKTVALIESYADRLPLRVIISPGANISEGRNIAIRAATGDVIASTDAGVRLSSRWLEKLIEPFEQPNPPEVIAGFFEPDIQTVFEIAMGATVLPEQQDINPKTFLPSSRSVAFKKSAWEAVGGYPEWLDYCEDLIFDLNLKKYAGNFAFAPDAVAYFKPRTTLRAFFKQYYLYARGDGKADLWRKRHAIRYGTYFVGVPLLIWLLMSGRWIIAASAGIIGALGMFFIAFRRLFHIWQPLSVVDKVRAFGWIPIIRITGDIAKMVGYPVGWWWRLKTLPTDPRLHWRKE